MSRRKRLCVHVDVPGAFYDSLDRILEVTPVQLCLPAHGHPFRELAERVAAIKRHHDERLDKLVAIANRIGPATVEQFAQELFPPRSWGPMAESEAYAHLEHMRLQSAPSVASTPTAV